MIRTIKPTLLIQTLWWTGTVCSKWWGISFICSFWFRMHTVFVFIMMKQPITSLSFNPAHLQSWGTVVSDLPVSPCGGPHDALWPHLLLAVYAALPLSEWEELVQVPHLLWGRAQHWPQEVCTKITCLLYIRQASYGCWKFWKMIDFNAVFSRLEKYVDLG